MTINQLKDQELTELLEKEGVALVEFGAKWCGPCQTLLPLLGELAEEYKDEQQVSIVKVDVDQSPELAAAYGIMSMPTVLFFVNGEPVSKLVGLRPKATYRTAIDQYLVRTVS